MAQSLEGKTILLIVSGGIAAYKSLELIRLIRKAGGSVRCVLTEGGSRFVTPLSLSALSEHPAYTDLWSLKDESEMGHIRLAREADLILIAPASANMIARMAHGLAGDLASAILLAADKSVLIAPAMNPSMWAHPATQANVRILQNRGVAQIGPAAGDMACGETGLGRMAEPADILDAACQILSPRHKPLKDFTALVTAGPTYEPLDPVRFIGNRSSGKQGYAIAKALADLGARVTLVSGPVDRALADSLPEGISLVRTETAREMMAACEAALHADIAVCAAAVSDWAPESPQTRKIKKDQGTAPPNLALKENPDILKILGAHAKRPRLLIGFAAETENLLENAAQKLKTKNADWILANEIGAGSKIFGADENHVYLITPGGAQDWGHHPKSAIARRLAETIASHFGKGQTDDAPAKAAE